MSDLNALKARRLLLISNSTAPGGGWLDHCAPAITSFLSGVEEVLLIPYALVYHSKIKTLDAYEEMARARFAKMGFRLTSLHAMSNRYDVIESAQAFYVGGGNTYALLARLQELGIHTAISRRANAGVPYVGVSAGSNVACPTIRTTNDWQIVTPRKGNALDLFPYQINAHFFDADPASTHMGETREERIAEFQAVNPRRVIGLREGSWIRVENGIAYIEGAAGAKIFDPGTEPHEWLGPLDLCT